MKIALIGAKGGTGKTTTVVTLARLWRAQRPLLLDMDTQAATQNFARVLKPCRVVASQPSEAAYLLDHAQETLILVDCPPDLERSRPALSRCDLAIVPTQTEFLALRGNDAAIRQLQTEYSNLRVCVLLTMFVPSMVSHRNVRDAAREEYGAQVFNTIIHKNNAVALASEDGKTVFDVSPDGLTARQYEKLAKEILCPT